MRDALKLWSFVAAATLLLTGCGLKGPLELPQDAKAQAQTSASAESGQGKAESTAPKPHKGFILDDLIR
jgi:predicted small lipoprotein YifL